MFTFCQWCCDKYVIASSDLCCVYSIHFQYNTLQRWERCGNGAESFGVGPAQLLEHALRCEVTGGGDLSQCIHCSVGGL